MWKDEWFGECSSSYVTKRGVPQETRFVGGGWALCDLLACCGEYRPLALRSVDVQYKFGSKFY